MFQALSKQMLHDRAMLEQAARVCHAEYQVLRYSYLITESDGRSLTAVSATESSTDTQDVLNADSKASWTANRADIKGGKKQRNRHLARMMRANLASEAAAVRMFGVQSKWGGKRPDLEFFKVQSNLPMGTFCLHAVAKKRVSHASAYWKLSSSHHHQKPALRHASGLIKKKERPQCHNNRTASSLC